MQMEDEGPPSAAVAYLLGQFRRELLELFSHYCGAATSLSLQGWLSFAEAFDVCPGYLAADKMEEVYEAATKCAGRTTQRHAATRAAAATLSFSQFQDGLCLLASAIEERRWQVEYSAEKAARYRYKLKDAEKGRVEPGPEERMEGLLLALEINEPAAYRARAGIEHPTGASAERLLDGQAHDGLGSPNDPFRVRHSPSDLEEKLKSLRIALAKEQEDARAASGLSPKSGDDSDAAADGGAMGFARNGTTGRRVGVPPAVGAGRNSRRSSKRAMPTSPRTTASIYGASAGGSFAPAPPSSAHPPGRPSSSPGPSSQGGRSPRRLRIAADQSAAGGARVPAPPTTPRNESRPASSSARAGTPRPDRPEVGAGPSGGLGMGGLTGSGMGHLLKENQPRPASGGSAGVSPVLDESESPSHAAGAISAIYGGSSSSSGAVPMRTSSAGSNGAHRLRETTNIARGTSAGAAGCTAQGSCQYYALSSRGREPQAISDFDFVHALLNGGPTNTSPRKRSGSATRSTSPREGATGAMHSSKPRPSSVGRVARTSVQAW
jgi:hypothetical protein